jgi:hypothetical protein
MLDGSGCSRVGACSVRERGSGAKPGGSNTTTTTPITSMTTDMKALADQYSAIASKYNGQIHTLGDKLSTDGNNNDLAAVHADFSQLATEFEGAANAVLALSWPSPLQSQEQAVVKDLEALRVDCEEGASAGASDLSATVNKIASDEGTESGDGNILRHSLGLAPD